jgi:hypothetical protein
MKKMVSTRVPIYIDLAPNIDWVEGGFLLKANKSISVFARYDGLKKRFDGFSVFRDRDIFRYRKWDKEEKQELKGNNHKELLNVLPLESMNTFYSCVKTACKFGLVEFYDSGNPFSFYLGKAISVSREKTVFRLVSKSGKWSGKKTISTDKIDFIIFCSAYTKRMEKKLLSSK